MTHQEGRGESKIRHHSLLVEIPKSNDVGIEMLDLLLFYAQSRRAIRIWIIATADHMDKS